MSAPSTPAPPNIPVSEVTPLRWPTLSSEKGWACSSHPPVAPQAPSSIGISLCSWVSLPSFLLSSTLARRTSALPGAPHACPERSRMAAFACGGFVQPNSQNLTHTLSPPCCPTRSPRNTASALSFTFSQKCHSEPCSPFKQSVEPAFSSCGSARTRLCHFPFLSSCLPALGEPTRSRHCGAGFPAMPGCQPVLWHSHSWLCSFLCIF
jgi:hypothetical protein